MDWWILEVIFVVVMLVVLAALGPLIKRFGRAYAADVFQANPRTGKSYLVLMDIAYYMIFGAYVLFVIKWEPDTDWGDEVTAAQLQASVVRLGGMVLLMGLLHGLNVLSLPLIGRVFTLNRQLDDDVVGGPRQPRGAPEHPDPDRDAGVVDITRRGDAWQRPAPPQRAE
jgi:hypothetical protein